VEKMVFYVHPAPCTLDLTPFQLSDRRWRNFDTFTESFTEN
jgi:hypothetical protein